MRTAATDAGFSGQNLTSNRFRQPTPHVSNAIKSLREAYFAGSGALTSTAATICHLPLRRIRVETLANSSVFRKNEPRGSRPTKSSASMRSRLLRYLVSCWPQPAAARSI
jgi:hypothetical protein